MKSLKKLAKGWAVVLSILAFAAANAATSNPARVKAKEDVQIGKVCIECHKKESPGLVTEWKKSAHAPEKVDCYDCHKGKDGEPGVIRHEKDKAGKPMFIQTIVSPKRCAVCHEKEVAQQQRSHHAKAGQILASLDNIMGEVIGGPAAVNAGCLHCHGGPVKPDADGEATPETWPNTGIGRLNVDGSRGSCSACHARHRFSAAQARTPDTCGKCHLGPDHPQMEVYNESKHGILYRANVKEMKLDAKKWIAGVTYTAAPTCATCHMSATKTQEVTHDVGERISWTLRPPISTKLNMVRLASGDEFDQPEGQPLPKVGDAVKGSTVTEILTWEDRRKNMTKVCYACHGSNIISGHYKQFDDVVNLYNEKFAKPIAASMKELTARGYITAAPFDDKIEWTWWEIWHHEGRRARHGASMMGPDYTWWHGMYEVAQHTYFKWIPEMRAAVMKKDGNEKAADEILTKYFKPIDGHDWYFNGISKDAVEKVRKGFEERYGKGSLK
ncbi:MAG: cytochrome C552 [Rhodocyclales bacterium]|nr:cytochrome C552 [Rhodocyclales bacterium]